MTGRAVHWLAGLTALGTMVGAYSGCGSSSCDDTRTCGGSSHDGGGGQAGDAGAGGGGTGGQPDAAGSFTLALDKSSLSVTTGASAAVKVTVTRTGTPGPISLELVGAPSGVSAAPITLQATDTSVSLSIAASASATQGTTSLVIRGTGGTEQHDATLSLLVRGQPGTLDQSFGTAGVVDLGWVLGATPVGPVVAGDGSVFVAGSHSMLDDLPLEVMHVPTSGTPDPSFGGSGKALFPAPADTYARSVNGMVLDAQGNLVLAATRSKYTPTPVGPFVSVGRMKPNGTIDSSFGSVGEVGGANGQAFRVLVQSDDKILIAGRLTATSDLFVHRVDAIGIDDPSYGTSANAVIAANGFSTVMAGILATASGGSRLVFGIGGSTTSTTDVEIAELDAAGQPTSFGTSGVATLDAGGEDTPFAVVGLPSGGLVMGGSQDTGGFIMQVTPAGAVDASFGVAGVIKLSGGFVVKGLARDGQGRIVAVGPTSSGWRAARYATDGTPDTAFGNGGVMDSTAPLTPSGVAILPDERIVVLASEVTSMSYAVQLARLWP